MSVSVIDSFYFFLGFRWKDLAEPTLIIHGYLEEFKSQKQG